MMMIEGTKLREQSCIPESFDRLTRCGTPVRPTTSGAMTDLLFFGVEDSIPVQSRACQSAFLEFRKIDKHFVVGAKATS